MGKVVEYWGKAINSSLLELFNGEDASIDILTSIISDGSLIDGAGQSDSTDPTTQHNVHAIIAKVFFTFAIPTLRFVSLSLSLSTQATTVAQSTRSKGSWTRTKCTRRIAALMASCTIWPIREAIRSHALSHAPPAAAAIIFQHRIA